MKMNYDGTFSLTIEQVTEENNEVLYIDMESGLSYNIEKIMNEDGQYTILRIEGKDQIDDLIKALINFKNMRDL